MSENHTREQWTRTIYTMSYVQRCVTWCPRSVHRQNLMCSRGIMQYMCRWVHMRCVYHRIKHKHVNVVINTHVYRRPKWHESTVQISTSQAHETRARLFKSAGGSILFVTNVATDKHTNCQISKTTKCGKRVLTRHCSNQWSHVAISSYGKKTDRRDGATESSETGVGVKEYHACWHFWPNRLGKKRLRCSTRMHRRRHPKWLGVRASDIPNADVRKHCSEVEQR